MDGRRFDEIARTVAATPSRRRVLQGLIGGAGAGAATLVGFGGGRLEPSEVAAVGSGTCRRALPSQFVSKQACATLRCGPLAGETELDPPPCVCVQTVGHVPTCVKNFDPANVACPAEAECNGNNAPCKSGFVCAKLDRCCGEGIRTCLRPCAG